MTATPITSSTPTWSNAIARPGREFARTPLSLLSGRIPAGLQGTLYRNGVGRLERNGQRVGHWFDGDGAILAVHFTGTEATATYRYVQTAGYQAEEDANQWLYAGYGMTAPGPLWNHWRRPVKNAANTSVLALPDRLLALWEGGQPHALDLDTLHTQGLDNLGALTAQNSYSAHPKYDQQTGDIFNFGVSPGTNGSLNLYRSRIQSTGGDRPGTICQQNQIPLNGMPLIHDFILAGPYLLFCIPPVRMNALPALLGLRSFSEALQWQPQFGTQLLVIDRQSLTLVSRSEAEPWYQWHFGNGYVDGTGQIVFTVVRFPDFQTNQYLKEVATGETCTYAKGTLWQMRLHPQSGKLVAAEELVERGCEFPQVAPAEVGYPSRYTYLVLHRREADVQHDLFGAIARFDHQTGTLTEANLGEQCYPSEPLYIADHSQPGRGWVMTVVFDGLKEQSEVWIFDSDRLDAAPICRLALPDIIPLSFHGTWQERYTRH